MKISMGLFLLNLLVVFINNVSLSQEILCNCTSTLEWTRKILEENDAGFHYLMNKGSEPEVQRYEEAYSRIKTTSDSITEVLKCKNLIESWLIQSRQGHLSIEISDSLDYAYKEQYFNTWSDFSLDENVIDENSTQTTFEKELEGEWEISNYTIKILKEKDIFIGVNIETVDSQWRNNMPKFWFKRKSDLKAIGEFYLYDYSTYEFDQVELIAGNVLRLGSFLLRRKSTNNQETSVEFDNNLKSFYESYISEDPFFSILSERTTYFRIPSFSWSQRKTIETIINNNKNVISQHQNLIIDLRGNGGGSDGSYHQLLELISSNTIYVTGAYYLSTKINNREFYGYYKLDDLTREDSIWIDSTIQYVEQHENELISLSYMDSRIIEKSNSFDEVPRVGIVVDRYCASSTEEFLLAAKQNFNVKIFGECTAGILDFANMSFVYSNDGIFKLGYARSISKRIPGYPIDNKGIQPDFNFANVEDHLWVERAMNLLESSF